MRREISEAKPVETKKQGTLEASVGKSFERLLENKGEKAEKKIEHNTTESFAKTEVKEVKYPQEITKYITSEKELEIYEKAGLQEAEIGGRKCLIRSDIDWNQKDVMGRTNVERAEQGLAPCDKDENPIELHHIGQHMDSPLAELTREEHRGKENYTILHSKGGESEIDRPAFDSERVEHWENRAEGRNV